MQSILWAATGTGFTFLMTTLGAAMVFLFRKQLNASIQRIFLGFAAGVMIAASVWSLLIPAMEEAEASGLPGWLPAVGGFVLGIGFLLLLVIYLLGMDEGHEFDGTIPTTEHEEGGLSK